MKIAVLSSHTSSLFWFRLDMMKAFVQKGHIVVAVGSESEIKWKEKFAEHNIEYRQITVERNGINPIKDLKTLKDLLSFIKVEKPDKIFSYQAKTIVYGCIAARVNKVSEVYPLVAGLGSVFRGKGFKNSVIKFVMKTEYWLACKFSKKIFFQNQDDKNEFIQNGLLDNDKAVIINGSGVNLEIFKPTAMPKIPTFLFIGRLIKDKGIVEYLEACKEMKLNYPEVRFLLVGPFDSNPSALKSEDLQPYILNGIIEYFGEQDDVKPFISQCNTLVLPSYHEGTPKTVLESMAMGRSIITTDAPGCRETVKNGLNGYLVKVGDINELVDKMKHLVSNEELQKSMGRESLKIAKEKYDVNIVNQKIIQTMNL